MALKVAARIQMTIEVEVTGAWDADTPINQIFAQAGERGSVELTNRVKQFYPSLVVIGAPKVVSTVAEEIKP